MENKTKSKFTFEAIVLAAALVLTLPLRTLQHLKSIEEYTGFYKELNVGIFIYIAILAVASVYLLVSAFMSRKNISLETKAKKLPGCGVLSGVTAIAVLWSAIKDFSLKDVDITIYFVSSTAAGKMTNIILGTGLVFGILSAVFFGVLAISFIMGKAPDKLKILSLSPVMWTMLRIIYKITITVSYLRVSDLALSMISTALFILFFMAFAQANSGVNTEDCEWRIVGFGLTGALIALNCFIPRAVLVLTGKQELMSVLTYADVSDLAISLFAIATVLTRIVPKISNIIEEPANTEEENKSQVE